MDGGNEVWRQVCTVKKFRGTWLIPNAIVSWNLRGFLFLFWVPLLTRTGRSHCQRQERLFGKGGKFLGLLVFEETIASAESELSEVTRGIRAERGLSAAYLLMAVIICPSNDQNICDCAAGLSYGPTYTWEENAWSWLFLLAISTLGFLCPSPAYWSLRAGVQNVAGWALQTT